MNNNDNDQSTSSKNQSVTDKSHDNSNWSEFCDESILQLLDEPFDMLLDNSRLRTDEKYYGFDNNAGNTWIYPINLPLRSYQYNITRVALFRNTLVVLPTGLGKTFIAAVVMYNIYRWYPTGKVLFMAPTKPLVAQQIEACRKIMGIPLKDSAEVTGVNNKSIRKALWQSKRVFFATPQVVQSDINDHEQEFPFADIRLIVVDEAHKAKGRYAYTEVIQAIAARTNNFRVLALSATPGRRIEDVAEVVRNLLISHIEIRWENSIDVAPYTYKKFIKTVVVPFDDTLNQIRSEFIEILDPYIRYLIDSEILTGNGNNITRGWLVMEQKRFREHTMIQRHPNQSAINSNFSCAISLSYALELLERHGVRVFLNFFDDQSNSTGDKYFVAKDLKLKRFLGKLRQNVGPNPFLVNDQTMTNGSIPELPQDLDFGHPKFSVVREHLLKHFEKNSESKVIVFCEYRESVLLMFRLLLQHRPMIRPRVFVGQGGTGNIRAITQKQQIQIMDDFRSGVSNTLVATSVAEEGLDVGDVDLIVCFDISTKNPTRFIQRIGRTGRKKHGFVLMLATEGKEHALIKEMLACKDKTSQKIAKSREITQMLYKNCPRIVPPEFDPKCIETVMCIRSDEEEEKPTKRKSKMKKNKDGEKEKEEGTETKRRGRKAKIIAPTQKHADVRKFFKKFDLDEADREIFSSPKANTSKSVEIESVMNSTQIELNCSPIQTIKKGPDVNIANIPALDPGLDRLLQKVNDFKTNPEKFLGKLDDLNESDIINCESIGQPIKKLYLEGNYKFVKEKFEAMRALEAISDDDVEVLNDDAENQFKTDFTNIENIFGGRTQIEEFLLFHKEEDDRDILHNKYAHIFEGLEKRPFTDPVDKFLDEKIKEINEIYLEEDNLIEKENDEKNDSIVIDNNFDKIQEDYDNNISEFIEGDSKYMSQWDQFEKNKIKHQSTPLRTINNFFAKTIVKKSIENESPLKNQKELFPLESKILNDEKTADRKIESNLFDDDFDDYIVECDPTTEKTFVPIESRNEDNISVDNLLNLVAMKEEQLKSSKIQQKSLEIVEKSIEKEKSTSKADIEDFDYTEFFEPFDCDDFCGDENIVQPSQQVNVKTLNDKKFNYNISKNLFEDSKSIEQVNSGHINSIPRQLSDELFESSKSVIENCQKSIKVAAAYNSPKQNVQLTDTSPSVLSRKSNLSRLKLKCSENKSTKNYEFNSPTSNGLNKDIKNESDANKTLNDSPLETIAFKQRNKRAIESSDSDEQTVISVKKARITHPKRRKLRPKKCAFIDDEADASHDDSSNDEETGEFISQFVLDSVIVADHDVQDHPSVDMRAKYLESIKSPIQGIFKIPEPRKHMNYSDIFSQPVINESISAYKENSFVVTDDEVSDHENTQLCPLEQAEAILKARRRAKRKGLVLPEDNENLNLVKRRRIIHKYEESSDDN